ncbi:hypothetical protein [Deinococcus hopiensis]|uniref:DUF7666 domain-containing protein n=1 Tax=Deinococcus hopiensis KR-140 TaxID=695939 RepID=A0A1W1UK91_9DEIO|nr:hypothetical protein [Deinococcus hopiensis]SMB81545.1 hypothetical protein SAMN00790413_04614 [Deinococcus hopiensis KR-140]
MAPAPVSAASHIRTQGELDVALRDTTVTRIVVEGDPGLPLRLGRAPWRPVSIEVRGESNVIVEGWGDLAVSLHDASQAVAKRTSRVSAYGESRVDARDRSRITAQDRSTVTARDDSHVTARDDSRVTARDHARVLATGKSVVNAYDSSDVEASGHSQVAAHQQTQVRSSGHSFIRVTDQSQVKATGFSGVLACGESVVVTWAAPGPVPLQAQRASSGVRTSVIAQEHSTVLALDTSHIVAEDHSRVHAWDRVTVLARGHSHVHAGGHSLVEAQGNCRVTARQLSRVHLSDEAFVDATALVFLQGPGPEVQASERTALPIPILTDVTAWADFHGLALALDRTLIVYKAVDGDFCSSRGFRYAPGTAVNAERWNNRPALEDGLHFAPTPHDAHMHMDGAKRYLACRVRLEESVVLGGSCPTRSTLKSRRCSVLYEVNLLGHRV